MRTSGVVRRRETGYTVAAIRATIYAGMHAHDSIGMYSKGLLCGVARRRQMCAPS